MEMLNFLILNGVVLAASLTVLKYFFTVKNNADYLISVFIIALSQITGTLLVLGLAGRLFPGYVLTLNLAILLIITGLRLVFRLKPLKQAGSLSSLAIGGFFSNNISLLCLSVLGSFITVKLLINLANPPFGWDSLNYHFTFAVEWLKHGNLATPITIFDDPSPTYYPINGSLFYLWLAMPFRSVFIADLGQFPFFIIAAICAYSISRKIGVNKEFSFYAAALFMLIPNFFKQLQIAYVDVMTGALFLVCVNYLFSLREKFDLRNTLLFGLSLGLMIGTKTVALPYSILLILPFLVLLQKNRGKAYLVFILSVIILFFGCFSYIRNFIQTGNPLYPLNLGLFNINIFRGVMDRSVYASHFSAFDYSLGKMLFHEGLGAQGLLLILPAVFLAVLVTLMDKKRKPGFIQFYFFVLPLLMFMIYRFVIPLGNLRYLYALMGIGIISAFYCFSVLKLREGAVKTLVVICVLSSIPELAKRQELVVSVILSLAIFLILVFIKKIRNSVTIRQLGIGFTVFLLIVAALLVNSYDKEESGRYYKMRKYSGFWPDAALSWDWLNNNTTGNNIAYTGRAVPFPLYANKFKNNVYYVSVNDVQPAKLHYFKDSSYEWSGDFQGLLKTIEKENNYRGKADYTVWLGNLQRTNTEYVFIYSLQQVKGVIFPLEEEWAQAHPEIFQLVFSNSTIRIYKVNF